MKKLQTSLLVLALATTAVAAQANVYLGAGVGVAQSKAKVNTKIIGGGTTGAGTDTGATSTKPSKRGAILDVHAGHLNHINADWFAFEQLAIEFDTVKASKGTAIGSRQGKQTIDRMYNIIGSLGLGYTVAPTWNVYAKAGLANAAFRFTAKNMSMDIQKTTTLWGGTLGLGINKAFETHTIGLDYTYTRYQSPRINYKDSGRDNVYASEIKRPAYHTVMVKFSKAI